jgi:hypothetical protein
MPKTFKEKCTVHFSLNVLGTIFLIIKVWTVHTFMIRKIVLNSNPFQGRGRGRGRLNSQPYQNINIIQQMNANYAYQQGLMEGAGLTKNQPKRKLSPLKNEQDFRKKDYKNLIIQQMCLKKLSEGEEDEVIDDDDMEISQPSNDQSIIGDSTLGILPSIYNTYQPRSSRSIWTY